MRLWWCVLVFAGFAAGDERAPNPKVALPVAPKAGKPASVPTHLPMVVTLTKEGRIIVSGANLFLMVRDTMEAFKVKPGHMHVSLDRLQELFHLAIAQYEILAKAGSTRAFKGRDRHRVFLRKLHIRADKDAPWAFVQCAAMVAAEVKVMNVQLALDGKRTLDLPLPAYKGAWSQVVRHVNDDPDDRDGPDRPKPPPYVVVEIRDEDSTRYRVGDVETTKPEQLEATLRKRLAEKPAPKIVVRADLTVAYQSVVTACDRIYAAGAKEMWWLGSFIPPPGLRETYRLPKR